jgi:hypothetical protein
VSVSIPGFSLKSEVGVTIVVYHYKEQRAMRKEQGGRRKEWKDGK